MNLRENTGYRKRLRARRRKRRIRQVISIIIMGLIIYLGWGGAKKLYQVLAVTSQKGIVNAKEESQSQGQNQEDYIDGNKEPVREPDKEPEIQAEERLAEEILNSQDPIIQDLLKMAEKHPRVNELLHNLDSYPEVFLELASKKEELIDFVLDYPNRQPYSEETWSGQGEYKDGEIPLFIQWDKRWGYEKYGSNYLAANGCGPTSLAMVVAGLTGDKDMNPKVMADFSRENGYLIDGVGTSWELMTKGARSFGLRGREIPLSESSIINTLKKGQPIIASMEAGTFTSIGHFLVLTGVDENDRIIINDSDSRIRSKETWDVEVFMEETRNLWTFTLE